MSALEDLFALHVRASHLPEPVREFVFAPPRRWRADFAFVAHRLLIEIEGGVWSGGRHTRPSGFIADVEKYNAATMLGYRILRFTGSMVRSGAAIATVIEALNGGNHAEVS